MKIRKFVHDENGDKKLITKGRIKFYKPKPGPPKSEVKNMAFTITDGSVCDCEAVTNPGKNTLVMGSKQGDRYVITYISDWSKKKEFKRAIRAIRKGHDCKMQIEQIAGQTDANNGGLITGGKPDVDVSINGDIIDTGDKKEKDKNRNKSKKKKDRENKTKRRKKDKSGKGKKEEDVDKSTMDTVGMLSHDSSVKTSLGPLVYFFFEEEKKNYRGIEPMGPISQNLQHHAQDQPQI